MKKRIISVLSLAVLLFACAVPISADSACVNHPSGMVSWWGGDNNALDIGGTNNGTLMNGAAYATGKVGQAFSFDGGDDYLEVPNSATLDLTGGLAMTAWVNLRSLDYSTIFSKADYNGSQSVTSYGLQVNPGGSVNVALYGTYPEDNWTTAAGLITLNNWYHIVLTWDGTIGPSDNVRLYINGALVQAWTKSPAPLNTTTQTLTLGSMKPPTYYGHMNGLIDEAAVFSRGLTAEEIAAIYNAGIAGMCRPSVAAPSGLVSWWKGENNANDQFGINNGALMNGASFAQGKVGRAFSLDGADDYVRVPDSPSLNIGAGDFSLNLWVNYAVVRPGNVWNLPNVFIAQDEAGGWGPNKWVFYSADDGLYLHINGGNQANIGPAAFTPQTGQWYHLALTRSGTVYSFYVNGALAGTINDATTIPDVNAPLAIGQAEGLGFFSGLIDEAAIFNKALNADEIASIYNAGSSGMSAIPGVTPDAFTFIAQTGMPLSTAIVSNPITVTGINTSAVISIAGGEYSVSTNGGGTWSTYSSTTPASVGLNDQVKVRQTSSSSNSATTTATLTIGGVSGAFNVTTAAANDPNASGLIAWWKAENNAYDSVGGNHGIWSGTSAYAPGIAGEAVSLNGNSKVSIPAFDMGSDWTITAAVNPHGCSDNSHCPVLARSLGNQDGLVLIYLGPSHGSANQFALVIGGGAWQLLLYSGTTYQMDQWHQVVASKSGDTYSLYVDGTLNAHQTVPGASTGYQSRNVEIGHWFYSVGEAYTAGLIDEVKIYNRALSAEEVATLADVTPDPFSFTAQTGVARSTPVESNAITVTGISCPSAISITGGEYAISADGSTWGGWNSTAGTISLNNQVKVRQTSSAGYSTTTSTTLTIGGVSGTFSVTTIPSYVLTITKSGTGGGTVTSDPAGINCGSACSASYAAGNPVDISASADSNSGFIGFTVDCIANTSPCHVVMDSAKDVTATFTLKADFDGTPVSGQAPMAVQFTDRSIAGAASWSWNFGDGGAGTLRDPVHMYKTAGSFAVSLTANGATTTKPGYITVTSGCASGPVMIGGSSYSTIQVALGLALQNDVIKVQALDFSGPLECNQINAVRLQGGYDCGFNTNPGFATVQGNVTFSGGTVTIENITVQ